MMDGFVLGNGNGWLAVRDKKAHWTEKRKRAAGRCNMRAIAGDNLEL